MVSNLDKRCANKSPLYTLGLLCAAVIFLSAGCEKKEISQKDALRIAEADLVSYSVRNKMSVTQFDKPEIRYFNETQMWEIYYQSRGVPKHMVAIWVDYYGGNEMNFKVEE